MVKLKQEKLFGEPQLLYNYQKKTQWWLYNQDCVNVPSNQDNIMWEAYTYMYTSGHVNSKHLFGELQ